MVEELVRLRAEIYNSEDDVLTSIFIRIYLTGIKSSAPRYFTEDQIATQLAECSISEAKEECIDVRKIEYRKRQYPKHITRLKSTSKERKPFIVADTETVMINDIHVPYAAGFLVIEPGDAPSKEMGYSIETYFSEDNPASIFPTIHKRSNKMLSDFLEREELKYARSVGYKVIPLSGYMFQKMNPGTPFGEFVGSLFESRLKARKEGFQYAEKLSDEYYIVAYKTNTERVSDAEWRPPSIVAVQMSAAIIACARIHMHPYISREDCYYTDTDSVILGSPLPDDDVSPTELGKFKLEHKLNKGIFLAPKGYSLWTDKNHIITKHKGLAKLLVSDKWYETQYADLKRRIVAPVDSNFLINWATLDIMTKLVKLSTQTNTKREPMYDNNQDWVDTKPVNVKDYAGQDKRVLLYKHRIQEYDLQSLLEEVVNLRSKIASLTSDSIIKDKQGQSQRPDAPKIATIQRQGQSNSSPAIFIHPPKKNKKKKKHIYS
ncbi:dna polymerase, partial [Nicotiana attenuata]